MTLKVRGILSHPLKGTVCSLILLRILWLQVCKEPQAGSDMELHMRVYLFLFYLPKHQLFFTSQVAEKWPPGDSGEFVLRAQSHEDADATTWCTHNKFPWWRSWVAQLGSGVHLIYAQGGRSPRHRHGCWGFLLWSWGRGERSSQRVGAEGVTGFQHSKGVIPLYIVGKEANSYILE